MSRKGLFITFEGNEGCGKTTQIRLLYEHLKKSGRKKVMITREPGGTRISDGIRAVLLDNKNTKMTGVCETLLYMASRAQLVNEVIKPKLAQGYVVLCDRWLDATVAYQGYGEGIDIAWIEDLGNHVTDGIRPDRTVFLNLRLETGLKRAKAHKPADRMERKKLSFHKRVFNGFLEIARKNPDRFKRVYVALHEPPWDVHKNILKVLRDVL